MNENADQHLEAYWALTGQQPHWDAAVTLEPELLATLLGERFRHARCFRVHCPRPGRDLCFLSADEDPRPAVQAFITQLFLRWESRLSMHCCARMVAQQIVSDAPLAWRYGLVPVTGTRLQMCKMPVECVFDDEEILASLPRDPARDVVARRGFPRASIRTGVFRVAQRVRATLSR